MHHYVYRVTNTFLNKHYYGSRTCATDPVDDIRKYLTSSKCVKKDITEHGIDNFKLKIVFVTESRNDAYRLENKCHVRFNVSCNPNFYNKSIQTLTGFSFHGCKHSVTTRKKMSIDRKGSSPWNKDKKYNMTREERQIKFTSRSFLGKKHTDEAKNKMKSYQRANKRFGEDNSFFGKKHTEETKQILSNMRSVPITMTMADGKIYNLPNRKYIGKIIGMTESLGCSLVRESNGHKWSKYNIKNIEVCNEEA